jgi:cell division protein FtsW
MNEGSRWIKLPIINMTMQTSDLAKMALFMYLARLLSKKQDMIKDLKKGYLMVIWPVLVTCMLIAPANLSTALLLGASCMLLLFIGRASTKHLLLTIGAALIPITFLIVAAVVRHHSENTDEVTAVVGWSPLFMEDKIATPMAIRSIRPRWPSQREDSWV